jgi:hypothetical protein
MRACRQCGGAVEAAFRFCPWCAAAQRSKLVEFFLPHPLLPGDLGKALRVSRYLGRRPEERHVRFSVWSESGRAEAAVSLDEAEAERLASFLAEGSPSPTEKPTLITRLLG